MFSYKHRYLFILLLSAYSYLNIKFTEGQRLFSTELPEWIFFGTILILVLFIWEGNRLIEKLNPTINFRNWVIHPLLVQFLLSLCLVISICWGLVVIDERILRHSLSISETKLALSFGFRINLFLYCINTIVFFNQRLKKTQAEADQFKMESIEARYEALRSQINPHFLFNSFNVLSTLVYRDADTASQFISQLSDVYRYLLSTKDNKVVKLEEEMQFLDSYLYLLRIRFNDSLIVHSDVAESKKGLFIPPSTLQLLIENAIKHNIISKRDPLVIKIYDEEGFIVISNNLNPKKVKEPSTRVGLENIKSRYRFINDRGPIIDSSDGFFTIKVPLIEITA
ncbi:Histidine kinase [Imperialibacter sp. EC-SDR9]|nr:Sensor protein lytS [Imperialibacter sp. 89]CAD5294838.1 Sensor protein lytS [Imperialibacter sp. 75]VVT26791.1 Histidine kinase [Imperialibacter sp. EC-SDR9]